MGRIFIVMESTWMVQLLETWIVSYSPEIDLFYFTSLARM
jgi:hypothetical protein